MTGKLGVGEDSMTTMVMCARTPFFLTTKLRSELQVKEQATVQELQLDGCSNFGPNRQIPVQTWMGSIKSAPPIQMLASYGK